MFTTLTGIVTGVVVTFVSRNMKKFKVAIIGVGLIGGSLGMALRSCRKRRYHVTGIGRNAEHLAQAKRRGAVDDVSLDIAAGVRDADIVVIGTPVDTIADMVNAAAPLMKSGAVITDAGGVKERVERDVLRSLRIMQRKAPCFVGAHPMAGHERSGIVYAAKDIYDGAAVAVVPPSGCDKRAFQRVVTMWKDAGAIPLAMTAPGHDTAAAVVSHLPHIIAFALSRQAAATQQKVAGTMALAAGSFRDVTRVADSSPRDWAAICHANRRAIRSHLSAHIRALEKIRASLDDPRALERCFLDGHESRARLYADRRKK